jgi:hypothetical protein
LLEGIRKSIKDMLAKSDDLEARKAFTNLIYIISKIVIQFLVSPKSRFELDLCKNYIKMNNGFIVMALRIPSYNKKLSTISVNEEIIKIRGTKASNLEELLNDVIMNGELNNINGIIDLPIRKTIYLLDEKAKASIREMCTYYAAQRFFKGGYPRCLVDTDPLILDGFLDRISVHLSEDNTLARSIKGEETMNIWKILVDGDLGGLRFKNFSQ